MKKKLIIPLIVILLCVALLIFFLTRRTQNFDITFDSTGGSSIATQIIKKGLKAIKPADPTREGYIFDGWYIDLNSNEKYDFGQKILGNITLKAKWIKVSDDNTGNQNNTCTLTCDDGYKLVNGDSKDCKCEKVETNTTNNNNSNNSNNNNTNKPTNNRVNVSSITLSHKTLTLVEGGSQKVTATVNPSNATNKNVTWKSSNTNVATVNNGEIKAISVGTATITATAGGKSVTLSVTVVSKDASNLEDALASITPKTIEKGSTSINYTYDGCTIENTANTVSSNASARTTVRGGVVSKLFRPTDGGTIESTYRVTCGNESDTKTVTHTISASTYTYTAEKAGDVWIIKVSGATNYTLSNSLGYSNLKYNSDPSVLGAQVPSNCHKAGITYMMTFDSDANTIYQVKSAQ